ncbi:Putative succinylglutamate desuccinylase/aspartoacylase [Septoria linicola]|uniref:Succinylglutamate desuccinylase/aspartoacylase n=1 Tax=Septoria linicola TaxID=215465 RepID=A0A9Q9AMR7_9PEZI|nr:putative succinylglutamate desuccinylase/aspartoacylase [Septoria linicola]USW50979.1 Putative succinylglutamate desuccinylase/aspartoacylase [Septoria linicola]
MKSSTRSVALLGALASGAPAATIYTGDRFQGYPIISSLDVNDVPNNTVSRFWLSPAAGQGGLAYFLPIFVARGTEESLSSGRRLSLSASIHGDELNPVAIVQSIFRQLNQTVAAGDLNGTVIGLPTQNPQGNFLNQRNFFTSSSNGFFVDLNRNFPGLSIEDGGSLIQSYTSAIWNDVWGNASNVDIAVDFHTLSTGSVGPLWAYADYSFEGVQRMAELLQPDMIKVDPGEPGSIETTWVSAGVPAITVETGPANIWNRTLIQRTVDFAFRLMDDLQMTNGEIPEPDLSQTFIVNNFTSPRSNYSGWIDMDIEALDDVQEGQVIGRVYNSWGDELQNLTSSVSGRVLTVLIDPAVEAGAGVATIGYNATAST